MRIFALFSLLLLAIISFSQGETQAEYDQMVDEACDKTVPYIQTQDLYQRIIDGEKMYILDTRERKEYRVSAIEGAIQVGFLFYSKRKVKNIDKSATVIVYCTIGARSETIGERLLANGFEQVYNLYGGIIQWANDGLPVYREKVKTNEVHVYSKKWGQWLNQGNARY